MLLESKRGVDQYHSNISAAIVQIVRLEWWYEGVILVLCNPFPAPLHTR